MSVLLKPHIAKSLLKTLNNGVVPRTGLGQIAVGRKNEINALLDDLTAIREAGAAFRLISGNYGSGKTFLLQLIRNHAMEQGFIVLDADLTLERRLTGSKGEGLATYTELVKNLSTRTFPDGGALPLLLEKWIHSLNEDVMQEQKISKDDTSLDLITENKINETLNEIQTTVGGSYFSKAISLFWESTKNDDNELKNNTLKWLRGEYITKTEAKKELGIGAIITDKDWYEYIKLFAIFAVKAGYKGMLILIDELVSVSETSNATARQHNYEKLLSIFNDTTQGHARYLGVIMGATPQCIEDERRGVFSHKALQSRLEKSLLSDDDTRDFHAPIIKLKPLEPEEMCVLVEKLQQIHGFVYGYSPKLTQDDLTYFIQNAYSRVGATQNITPREIIKDFLMILDRVKNKPQETMRSILDADDFEYATSNNDDELIKEEFKGFEV